MSTRDHESVPVVPLKTTDSVDAATKTGGEALPPVMLAEMTERFGVDFGDVRIHRDAPAQRSAAKEGAQAYTHDSEITFARGKYNPATATGRELIAHELAHVVQQRRASSNSDAEGRADSAASAVVTGRSVNPASLGGAPAGVQTKPDDAPKSDVDKPAEEAPTNDWRKSTYVLDDFKLDKDTLSAAHLKQIDDIAFSISLHTGMLARGKAKIEIIGHADTTGKDPHNDELGQKRADRVREALNKKLTPSEGAKPLTLDWSARSAGEKDLLVPTQDEKLEPRNRAVEIRVTIESVPVEKPAAPPTITLDPRKVITEEPPPSPPRRPVSGDVWKKMDENQRKIDEYDKKHPRKPKSAQDVVVDLVMETTVDPLVRKLPISKKKQDWLREKIKGGIEAGTEKACEAVIDSSGATGPEADALKAACKAAIKTKESK